MYDTQDGGSGAQPAAVQGSPGAITGRAQEHGHQVRGLILLDSLWLIVFNFTLDFCVRCVEIGSLCIIQNTIQKQKTQLSNLEDENKLMQAEVKRMESQV